jgi:glycosyltransferase involved in cell wall biosynthesis
MLTWEFPPRVVGQLAYYVNALAAGLVKKNVEVFVVTYHNSWVGYHQGADGIKAHRVSDKVRPQINVLTWILSLNQEAERAASDVYYSVGHSVNLLDVHDWHFVPAAVTLKKAFGVPFVFSVDSIEYHRSGNMGGPLNVSIRNIESLGITEAAKIIVKSEWMKQELKQYYNAPEDKVHVVLPYSEAWTDKILEVYEKR